MFVNKIKKFENQTLKILLNNNALLNSKSSKKYIKNDKNDGLLKLIKDTDNNNKNSNNNINEYQSSLINNNNQMSLNINRDIEQKNKIFSYLDYYRRKQRNVKNKYSHDEKDKNQNIGKSNSQNNHQKNKNNISNNIQVGNNNFSSNSLKNKSCKLHLSKGNKANSVNSNKNYTNNKNQIDSLINKMQINAFNSMKKMVENNKQKIFLKNENKNYLKLTRNSNYNINKIGLFGLTSYITNSNQNEMPTFNKNNNNINNNIKTKIRLRSNKKNLFYNSPSSIFDFIKMSKLKKSNNNNNINDNQQQQEQPEIKNNHIQNVNININNQINIGFNNFKDIICFNGGNKNNKVGRKILSRNNRNIEYKTISQNKDIHNRHFQNVKGNNNNIFHTSKLSTINNKNSLGRNGHINSNKELKVINQYLFQSFKTINISKKKI